MTCKAHVTRQEESAAGHEIGNHSFNHEPWLHFCSEGDFESELEMAEAAIQEVTGVRVNGFRGPGYSITEMTLGCSRSVAIDTMRQRFRTS